MAYYGVTSSLPLRIVPSVPQPRAFSQHIESLSPQFCSVYNQALASETYGLDELTGMGYRKALEFLIKDYVISLHPDDAESVRTEPLARCISERISYDRLKTLAQRAAWIGNDFTHYDRRFNEYEIADLKRFIDVVVFWVEAEMTTDEAEQIEPRK